MTETTTAPGAPAEAEIAALLKDLAVGPGSNLIDALQRVQERFGFLPGRALAELSQRTRIPLSRIYGVVTFYAQFYTEPRGRHTVRCCLGTACHVKGGTRVLEAVEQELGIAAGESTDDLAFYIETVACLGTCFLAPVMMIDDAYYGELTPGGIGKILDTFRSDS